MIHLQSLSTLNAAPTPPQSDHISRYSRSTRSSRRSAGRPAPSRKERSFQGEKRPHDPTHPIQKMGRSSEKATRAGRAITLMVLLGGLTATLSFTPAASSTFLGGSNGALRRSRLVPEVATGATALTATTMRSHTNVWRRSVRNSLRMRGAIRRKRSWGAGMWDKFTSPPAGRAHDEVTFRSGCEGRTLTIPQGSPMPMYRRCPLIFFLFFLSFVVLLLYGVVGCFFLFFSARSRCSFSFMCLETCPGVVLCAWRCCSACAPSPHGARLPAVRTWYVEPTDINNYHSLKLFESSRRHSIP